jgi:hypothetical protein
MYGPNAGAGGIILTQSMIYGPDDRQWWDQLWTQVTNPCTTLIDLNRPEWVMDPREGITLEFWGFALANPIQIAVTLRGSLEVES